MKKTGYWRWLWNIISSIPKKLLKSITGPGIEAVFGILMCLVPCFIIPHYPSFLLIILFILGFILATHGIYRDIALRRLENGV